MPDFTGNLSFAQETVSYLVRQPNPGCPLSPALDIQYLAERTTAYRQTKSPRRLPEFQIFLPMAWVSTEQVSQASPPASSGDPSKITYLGDMTMKTNQLLMSSALVLNLCLGGAAFSQSMEEDSQPIEESSDSAMALGNVVEHRSGVTDIDQKPYEIYQIASATGMKPWFDSNFNAEATLPVHYLSETLREVTTLDGKPALAFMTSEYEILMRNLLVEDSESQLVLYRIAAENSSNLLVQILGFVPAEAAYTNTGRRAIQAARQLTAAANPPSSCQNNNYRFGTTTGTYNGVPAYSNCHYTYFSGQPNSYSGYTTGYKWQCVEYVARYFKAVFNKKIAGGNANTYCDNASAKGLKKSDNGKTGDKPQPGNVICSNGGSYGHCAIVRKVGSDYVEVIEQNFNNSSSDANHRLSLKKDSNGKYKVGGFSSSYPVACWMWPK